MAGREIERLKAQAAPASDPPGQQPETAEALIQRWSHWCRKFGEAAADEDDDGDARMAQEQIWAVEADMLAYPLPASPQAETMPTIQIGDIVQVGESTGVIDSASKATFWSQQVLDAIYRDPLWRRPTTGDE